MIECTYEPTAREILKARCRLKERAEILVRLGWGAIAEELLAEERGLAPMQFRALVSPPRSASPYPAASDPPVLDPGETILPTPIRRIPELLALRSSVASRTA